ncbi:DUF3307 domain-containing protein [Kaistella sp. PBT33-4]|uniref:DUF3307 domain-containing protein n=1 Tax=Kaistella sp. PBT33-4 TaxID=3032000 RepID=UPI0023D85820|nr:DUF3307 domain-containing protein [Kaistella sp. PBT33-4]MDF0719806.1 DUF3307 domain-containing protein [Kaistella sp. PBT33-4]
MILTKLILAHLIGDFILQPNKWVAHKEAKKTASPYLYLHTLIHTALCMVFLWDLDLWWIAALVGISHFIIDALKLHLQKTNNKKTWFITDQLLHALVIAGVGFATDQFDLKVLLSPQTLIFLTGAVFLTTPVSILIKTLLSAWTPVAIEHSKVQTESLTHAGKYIGILERLLVFTFIIVNHWEGVGFMIAAKSVFRFSDLAEAKQRKLTEYVLVGTLLSFGIAVMTGILVRM